MLVIPISVFFADIAILLDIPIFTEIIVFIFLSFIPGFAILKLFKLKEISFLDTILFSVALSIAFVMFMGLLVNEVYLLLDLPHPLSTLPLTVVVSAFTLALFFTGYRDDLSETLKLKASCEGKLKDVLPLSIILFLIPLLSVLGSLSHNVSLILVSDVIIAALCVMTVTSGRLAPKNLFPFLIFSISIALVCQTLLASKYVVGVDSNIEYYVFRLTQLNGHWSFLNTNVNYLQTLTYDSMLSITLLPAVYSALMQAQSEMVFKILYPSIFFLVPLTIYRICEKQFGKMIGLFSALFFVFTNAAFHGEPLGINRQIVGELFFILSAFLLISNTMPVTKRRWLLVIFGAALAVSHYTLGYIYVVILAIVFIISKVKPRFEAPFDGMTMLLVFAVTISWFAAGPGSPLVSMANSVQGTLAELIGIVSPRGTGGLYTLYAIPKVFTVSSWINLLLSGTANLFLIVGFLAILMRPKGKGIIDLYKVISTLAAIILLVALISPQFAGDLNFSRFYGVGLLFLSPFFVFGGQAILETIGKTWRKIKQPLKSQVPSKNKNIDLAFLLIAIILSAYFLSQVGFVNYVANGAVHTYGTDFVKMKTSNDIVAKMFFYGWFDQEQDVFSASWLLNHKPENADLFADDVSGSHTLVSYGLISIGTTFPITNATNPSQGSYLYLGSLNVVNGVSYTNALGSFNISIISPFLNQNTSLVYSNGNSEIFYVVPAN